MFVEAMICFRPLCLQPSNGARFVVLVINLEAARDWPPDLSTLLYPSLASMRQRLQLGIFWPDDALIGNEKLHCAQSWAAFHSAISTWQTCHRHGTFILALHGTWQMKRS